MTCKTRLTRQILMLVIGCFILLALSIPSLGKSTKGKIASGAAQEPLSVQDHQVEGVEVVLLEAKRTSGNTLTVKWQYRNKTGESKRLNHGAVAGMDSQRFAGDAYYLDANNKKYTVLKDERGSLLAARHDQFAISLSLAPKQVVTTWARFPAPPIDVERVTLHLPGAPPFDDVLLSK